MHHSFHFSLVCLECKSQYDISLIEKIPKYRIICTLLNETELTPPNKNLILTENEIYQYTVQEGDYITPKFINDLNKTAILYKKSDFLDSDSLKYDSEIIFAGKSQG